MKKYYSTEKNIYSTGNLICRLFNNCLPFGKQIFKGFFSIIQGSSKGAHFVNES